MHCKTLFFALLLVLMGCRVDQPPSGTEVSAPPQTALEQYVETVDSNYKFELRHTIEGEGFTAYILHLQSQQWLTAAEVKDPVWWHWLTIVVPDEIKGDIGLLYIGGGSRNTELPQEANPILISAALETNTITAGLHNVPNQPLEFQGDGYGPRVEDELIAYGWRKYLESGAAAEQTKWLARLPMTKSAVRAMDAISTFSTESLQHPVRQFTVMGGSKRGWTTWTTAIVDKRVVAIAPVVIDMLNVVPSFEHHWQVYGFWAPAVGDYVQEGIMDWQGTPEYQELIRIVEPYNYRDRLDLPKFLINATGDQFFIPDSWQFYWDELVGQKHLRYVANADHSLKETDALESFLAFYHAIVNEQPLPDYHWVAEMGTIMISTDPDFPPDSMWLWEARNTEARDFRVETIGKSWKKEIIPVSPDGMYQITVNEPAEGWTAFYVELQFPSQAPVPFKFTTGVVVTPDELPHPPFVADTKRIQRSKSQEGQ